MTVELKLRTPSPKYDTLTGDITKDPLAGRKIAEAIGAASVGRVVKIQAGFGIDVQVFSVRVPSGFQRQYGVNIMQMPFNEPFVKVFDDILDAVAFIEGAAVGLKLMATAL